MIEMFGVFAIGIVVGVTIMLFTEFNFKMYEADKQWKEKDE